MTYGQRRRSARRRTVTHPHPHSHTRIRSHSRTRRRRLALAAACAVTAVLLLPGIAYAAGAGTAATMPWTGPLQTLLDNLSGPTARIVAGLGFVIGGGIWAFSRSEEGAKRFGQIVIGAAIAIGAANI